MSYATAKTNFEATVKAMTADYERYAASGKATQRALDIKLNIINKLVEFYEAAEALREEKERENIALSERYSLLHADTQKLVTFAELHRVDPKMISFYKHSELQLLYVQGVRFIPPRYSFSDIKFRLEGDELKATFPHEKDAGIEKEAPAAVRDKYHHIQQLCSRR